MPKGVDNIATTKKSNKKQKKKAGNILLTLAQEAFVLRLVAGDSQRVAYRVAYPNCKAADSTVDTKASTLFAMDKVRARYDGLMDVVLHNAKKAAIASAEDVLRELSSIAMGTKTFPSYDMFGTEYEKYPSITARLKALELAGRHHKLFTDKQEIDASMSGTVKVVLTDD